MNMKIRIGIRLLIGLTVLCMLPMGIMGQTTLTLDEVI